MAVPNLDARQGGACLSCIASKFCSYVVAWFQVVFWTLGFLTLVFKPSSVTAVVKNMDTTAAVLAGLISLLCIGFSVLLVIGLHKDRRLYIKAYCIYVVVYLVMLAVSFVVNIFVQPQYIGFRGFISTVICFLLNVMFFFVIRSYYLVTYCNNAGPQLHPNQPKV